MAGNNLKVLELTRMANMTGNVWTLLELARSGWEWLEIGEMAGHGPK